MFEITEITMRKPMELAGLIIADAYSTNNLKCRIIAPKEISSLEDPSSNIQLLESSF